MRTAAAGLAATFAALFFLVLLVVNGGTAQDASALALTVGTSCGTNTDATSNTPYSGPLPAPRTPRNVAVVALTPQLRGLYENTAAQIPQVPWPVLAGIGNTESGQGANLGPSSAGAVGFMQFLPSTWALPDPNRPGHTFGDGGDPNDPAAAIPAAARLLVASGANGTADGLRAAIFAYNHSDEYVDTVLSAAQSYATGAPPQGTAPTAVDAELSCVPQDDVSAIGPDGCVSPVTQYVVTGVYGESRPGHLHSGLDMAAPQGTPIHNVCAGTVSYAGTASGYGNYICVTHTPTLTTCHGHASVISVAMGQKVAVGQVLGQVGSTGDSTGPHDHFEIRRTLWGDTFDPAVWLKQHTLPVAKQVAGGHE